ncbi:MULTISPECIES: DUF402 domain-containing protein [Paenarthrobacter]|uniref:DUF402 domain-containing protein n=1 Tax=Paenarthrobacter TaxID=1742992 RepID=UPI001669BF08|nr:DUF402 domain-containing protein [Paenarthrobacter nicotinovorans]MBP2392888.1 hypothetical protein [Paenarthrobacter nicotinovorans]UKF00818.1 YgaC family protein [Paenarthrobacter nicotinovorans]UKF05599.1 YgaC family protein [Paenarthrobacter nicotinovorans]
MRDDRGPGALQPGDLVVARNRKWDGTAHWVVPGRYLGEDIYGWWIFQGAGEFCSRPGAAFYTASDAILLVPRTGEYVATFYDDSYPGDFRIYVDLATAHAWTPIKAGVTEFHMIDMDLDVIRSTTHGVFVDDEDEFEEHRAAMVYPGQTVDAMRTECAALYEAVDTMKPPFDVLGSSSPSAEWFRKGRA